MHVHVFGWGVGDRGGGRVVVMGALCTNGKTIGERPVFFSLQQSSLLAYAAQSQPESTCFHWNSFSRHIYDGVGLLPVPLSSVHIRIIMRTHCDSVLTARTFVVPSYFCHYFTATVKRFLLSKSSSSLLLLSFFFFFFFILSV